MQKLISFDIEPYYTIYAIHKHVKCLLYSHHFNSQVICVVITQQYTRKRNLDQLISVETIDGGKLREAATKKNDQQILIHILDKDCVAIEVKYHKCYYRKYTSFLNNPETKESAIENAMHSKSFDKFCTIVKEQVIDNHNIWYMSRLEIVFINTVRKVESQDASRYATFRLRNRLKKRFPQLVFHTPKVRNTNDFVCVEDLSRESVVERLLTTKSDSQSDTSDDEEEDEDEPSQCEQTSHKTNKTIELKDLYM